MDLSICGLREASGALSSTAASIYGYGFLRISTHPHKPSFRFWEFQYPGVSNKPLPVRAKKRNAPSKPVLKPTIIEEVSEDDEDDLLYRDFEDEEEMDEDNYFEDEYLAEDIEPYAGDGDGGGGISLAGTFWDKEALSIAEEVCLSFDGDLKIYAFKTLANSTIRVRIEKLSNKSGSPSMDDIEAFSLAYRKRLDEAELSGSIPENVSLEVSSPGVERVVRIPQELDRFKDRPMYVKYISVAAETSSSAESDGIFRLVAFDLERKCCTWGLADVKVNREKSGKGRPLSKKQRVTEIVLTIETELGENIATFI
ncbi:uncharacterized protein LOC127798816 [Diospyros lotus]|uniref:uncharacterized protein LOC127798816 n=1 Tax=Diospyros lotus TaxID=55363 RepID=UPI002253FB10|nr:uncharacterized protein LOC127798816 [Diospyros lotus]